MIYRDDLSRRPLAVQYLSSRNFIIAAIIVENLLADSEGLQERPRWTDHDEGCMDDLQQSPLELFPTRRVSILLRRDPRRGLSSGRGNHLRYLHDSHVSTDRDSIDVRRYALIIFICIYVCAQTPGGYQTR